MKGILFLILFLSISFSGFAQYGKLEPFKDGDSTYVVLRTHKETLKKFAESPDKNERRPGSQIESVEKQSELLRSIYLSNRIKSPDIQRFINNIKSLESKRVNVNYYVQEMLIYNSKNRL